MRKDAPRHRLRRSVSSRLVLLWMLIGVAALDALIASRSDLWRQFDPDDYRERLLACRRLPRDLVIFGGSPVSEGFIPTVLSGATFRGSKLNNVFNLGLPGGTVAEFWHALEHGLAAPPKLLVYGVTASDMNNRRLEPHGPHSLMDWSDLAEWVRLRPRTAEWAVRHFAKSRVGELSQFNRYRQAMRFWSAELLDAFVPDLCPEAARQARINSLVSREFADGNGYAANVHFRERRLDLLKATGFGLDRFPFLERYAVGEHTPHLDRIVEWAKANDVALVLVDMPMTAELQDQRHPAAFATYGAFLRQYADEHGLTVIDAHRNNVGLTDADFADFIHLNRHGAAKLSAWLRERLE